MTILKQLVKTIRDEFKKLPDSRGKKHQIYTIEDIAMSAHMQCFTFKTLHG